MYIYISLGRYLYICIYTSLYVYLYISLSIYIYIYFYKSLSQLKGNCFTAQSTGKENGTEKEKKKYFHAEIKRKNVEHPSFQSLPDKTYKTSLCFFSVNIAILHTYHMYNHRIF